MVYFPDEIAREAWNDEMNNDALEYLAEQEAENEFVE